MNGPEHQAVGRVTGLVLAVLMLMAYPSSEALGWMVLVVIAAIVGQIVPDLLDPASLGLWMHRSVGHSWAIAMPIYLAIGGIGLVLAASTGVWLFMVMAAFGMSAFAHLVMDATTPRGLPMFVGNSLLGMALPISLATSWIPIVNIAIVVLSLFMLKKRLHALVAAKGRAKATIMVASPFLALLAMYAVAFLIFSAKIPTFGVLLVVAAAILLLAMPIVYWVAALVVTSLSGVHEGQVRLASVGTQRATSLTASVKGFASKRKRGRQ
jgi:hypothetical protein